MLELWEKSGYANPDKLPLRLDAQGKPTKMEPYSIVLPPPNVTGTLHMGHAAMLAIEDILIRYHRMKGFRTLWLPGTDSAAIATQAKVEDDIYKKEKKTRHDIGREELLKRIEKFTGESKAIIINQLKKMGSSLDWSRYAYTMDEKRYAAVMEAFVRMYNAGLIYRGNRIVNWDPKLQTTVSDDEIEWIEQTTPFYYLKYGPFTIGTARPETKFGDKYVVMHPDDARYKEYKDGQHLELERINGAVTATIVKDEAVDMEFGTGVMTITPWHDAADFEIAQRHKLDKEQVIDDRGILLPIAGEFTGQHIKKARPLIVEKMKSKGLIERIDEKYANRIATNERGGGIIEPQIKLQWFIDVNKKVTFPDDPSTSLSASKTSSLKERMKEAVSSGAIKILPERFEKIYYHWIGNLRDWCISRQIWFGHRIPAWFRDEEVKVQVESPGVGWSQDPDTLDTWFSSGLWTFSTLGWPFDWFDGAHHKSAQGKPKPGSDLETYHPTNVLETGYDILFFWVARMILMSAFLLGDVPFRNVYLHGLVRDGQGRKMSKSLGNIIDPLDMIEKYGADATRLSLIMGAAPGNDMKLSEDRVRGYKHFANKLWNIARFVLEYHEPETNDGDRISIIGGDQELVRDAHRVAAEVSASIDAFRLDLAADQIYHYVWHRFADEIIEESKPILKAGGAAAISRANALYIILDTMLRLLHPFMPFVTEAIWKELPEKPASTRADSTRGRDSDLLMVAKWPV